MNSKTVKAGVLAAIILLAGYWYASPYLAVWQIRNAAQARDAEAFNRYVDYPGLRESIKGQFSALFTDTPDQPAKGETASAGAAFGKMLGLLVVNKFVDAVIRPETVMQAMRQGYLVPEAPKAGRVKQSGDVVPEPGNATDVKDDKPRLVMERQGVHRLLVYSEELGRAHQSNQDRLGFVFERSGFASWRLSAVTLPMAAKKSGTPASK
jgi:hypothetical protein